ARRQQPCEQERPRRGEMQPTRRRLGRRRDERDDERGAASCDRRELDVGIAVERHPQRNAHRAEAERREERQPDGGYTASSAPSGAGRPCEKSGMKMWASGPIATAYTTVPTPTLPPSSQPVTSTVSSSPGCQTRIEGPRAARPVIRPSRGPGPSPAPMYAPVAVPFSSTPRR